LQPLALPLTLTRLRTATDATDRDDAWAQFIAAHSEVLLHACHYVLHDHDAAMDGYAFVLDALCENGCQRLRSYVPRDGATFSTWLLVVARRLALDYFRHRYGRSRSGAAEQQAEQGARRRLEDLLSDEIDPDNIVDEAPEGPDAALRRTQLRDKLRQSIDELNPEDQLLLALRFRDARSARQIATVLHAPTVFHVYRRLGVVLSRLRSALEERGVDGSEP